METEFDMSWLAGSEVYVSLRDVQRLIQAEFYKYKEDYPQIRERLSMLEKDLLETIKTPCAQKVVDRKHDEGWVWDFDQFWDLMRTAKRKEQS